MPAEKKIPLSNMDEASNVVKVALVLVKDAKGLSLGVRLSELLKKTGLNDAKLYEALFVLQLKGLVSCKLIQVDTGGTTEPFWKMTPEMGVEVSLLVAYEDSTP